MGRECGGLVDLGWGFAGQVQQKDKCVRELKILVNIWLNDGSCDLS